MSLQGLEEIKVRLLKITTISHLLIGSGEGIEETLGVDKPMIRARVFQDGNYVPIPYLPASSFHGVVRSRVEDILRGLDNQAELNRQSAKSGGSRRAGSLAEWKGDWEKEEGDEKPEERALKGLPERIYRSVCDPLNEKDRCEAPRDEAKGKQVLHKLLGRPTPCCHACSIFGYQGGRGLVRPTQAWPSLENEDIRMDIITRVAINRITRSATPGLLFDMEAVPPGVVFYMFLLTTGLSSHESDTEIPSQETLLRGALASLGMGLDTLGAQSTVGFGNVEVREVFAESLKMSIYQLGLENANNKWDKLRADGDGLLPGAKGLNLSRYPRLFGLLAAKVRDKDLQEHLVEKKPTQSEAPSPEVGGKA